MCNELHLVPFADVGLVFWAESRRARVQPRDCIVGHRNQEKHPQHRLGPASDSVELPKETFARQNLQVISQTRDGS